MRKLYSSGVKFFNDWRRFSGTNHSVQIPCQSFVVGSSVVILLLYLANGPLPATVTTRITCLVQNSNVNPHLPLLRAAGHIQRFSNTWRAQCHPETVWIVGLAYTNTWELITINYSWCKLVKNLDLQNHAVTVAFFRLLIAMPVWDLAALPTS